jgi:hypothetical protein
MWFLFNNYSNLQRVELISAVNKLFINNKNIEGSYLGRENHSSVINRTNNFNPKTNIETISVPLVSP